MFLAALDQTVIATASLKISEHFQHVPDQSWLMTIYIATSLLTTPIYGRLSDSYGRRKLFLIGLTLFGVGSFLAACAVNFDLLIAARGIQGLGAGGLFSLAFAVIADVLPFKERGKYILFFVLIFGAASILGPILGGIIASQSSILGISGWRWIFIFNLPFLIMAIVQGAKHLPSVSHRGKTSFDWLGAALFGILIFGILAVTQGSLGSHLSASQGIAIFILLAALIAFIAHERRKGLEALFPPIFFENKAFRLTVLTSAVASGSMLVAMTVSSLTIQVVEKGSPAIAGVVLLAMGFGNFLGSGYANRIFSKERSHRLLAAIGLVILGTGFIPMILSAKLLPISIGLFLLGIGSGLINQFTSVMAPATLGDANRGSASAINTLMRQVGGLVGISAAMALIFYAWKVPTAIMVNDLTQQQRIDFIDAIRSVYIATAVIVFAMASLARLVPASEQTVASQKGN
jgi:MFS family permease